PRNFFHGDRRTHAFFSDTNLRRELRPNYSGYDPQYARPGGISLDWDGGFGDRFVDLGRADKQDVLSRLGYVAKNAAGRAGSRDERAQVAQEAAAPATQGLFRENKLRDGEKDAGAPAGDAPPLVRKNFADTALWTMVDTTSRGMATVDFKLPENLTTW